MNIISLFRKNVSVLVQKWAKSSDKAENNRDVSGIVIYGSHGYSLLSATLSRPKAQRKQTRRSDGDGIAIPRNRA